jgi:gamma-glutamyltranspeptidase / glutathione hydrolase
MMPAPSVAAGHPLTLRAALTALAAGGNAFDAVVAAGFTAAVVEPTLSGLGGGGFLMAAPVGADPVLFDFFVDTPGRGGPSPARGVTEPVVVQFHGAAQVFHVGAGSIATPGCLAGYLHVHARLGRLPLAQLVRPAAALARAGVVLGPDQAAVVRLLGPILLGEPLGVARFAGLDGRPFADQQVVVSEVLADFLEAIADGTRTSFADPDLAPGIVATLQSAGSVMTLADLQDYRVIERSPLEVRLGEATLITNPPPSFGGGLIATALTLLLERPPSARGQAGDGVRLCALADVLEAATTRHRTLAPPPAAPQRSRGTTHVSVQDADGNLAAMTTSNGSNSGVHLPGTGVMANNIMGEEDLHPAGLQAAVPGVRVGSMMAPSLLVRAGRPTVVLGSGGSERIRSALTQVIAALVLDDLPLADAVLAPRLHVTDGVVQVEPGLATEALARLGTLRELNVWSATDLYFGGVHAVATDGQHVGDPRRGGVSATGLPERPGRGTATPA